MPFPPPGMGFPPPGMGGPLPPGGVGPPPTFVPASGGGPPPMPPPVGFPPADVKDWVSPTWNPPLNALPMPPLAKLPKPDLQQTNPEFKKETVLMHADPNWSPEEKRARDPRYYIGTPEGKKAWDAMKAGGGPPPLGGPGGPPPGAGADADGPRGTKRARAEDLI
ncbi:hypothetical protein DL96DRAFT_809649 [Flagelloscypha sp. PMI_526]|nr:hypothetical protein DL96DRAFT_809649 [Flagelloscypha sp. PMI_526]